MPNTNQQNPEGANAQAKSTTRHNTEREAAKKKVTRFIHIILFVTIATVVAEICILLFDEKKELKLDKYGLVLIVIELIILIYLAAKYLSIVEYAADKDFSKNPLAVWSQIGATALIGIAGIVFTISNSFNESSRQQNEMATQLMSSREKSETDFRQNIFKPLIDQVFNHSLPLETRFYEFELFQNNFDDLFNSRSLYDVLWDEAQKKSTIKNADSVKAGRSIMDKLIKLAKYTNAQQELLISHEVHDTILAPNETFNPTFYDGDGNEKIKLTLLNIKDKESKKDVVIRLQIVCDVKGFKNRHDTININNGDSLSVSYFNSPLSDNFLMPDGDRIAVILEDIKGGDKAFIRIVHFPADYVTVGYRPSLSRVNELIEKKEKD
jgi:hypothetical protein